MLSDVGVWPGSTPAISAGPAPGLDDDASAGLPLPDAAELLAYMEATFGAFEGRVRAINDDTALDIVVVDFNGDRSTIADAIADATSHADRHLGMLRRFEAF